MKREDLEKLEIVDGKLTKESIDKVLDDYHMAIKNAEDKVKTLTESEKNLKNEIATRNKDLEELKKLDADGLQKKLDELQGSYDTLKTESENNLKEVTRNMLLENALGKTKAKDLNDIKKFIDMEKIIVDGEKLIGFDDQISELEKNKSYLFDVEETKKDVDLGGNLDKTPANDDDAFVNSIMGIK